ncbi:MAG TPA: DUF5615 family PIN-like protein [Afipia sp.]
MKVLIDENLPPAVANALQAFFKDQHEIVHLRKRFGPGIADVDWITKLNQEGNWVVISGDRRITRNKSEYQAFRNSRLIGFFLSQGLYKAKSIKQLERILALWENIEKVCSTVEGGAMFELPMKSTRVKQLKL